jgi:type II secretory pathway predicted ATPase ExeA
MYKNYWSMAYNPFQKNNGESSVKLFNSKDYINAKARLEHLNKLGGIGLLTGLSGTGKTYTLKKFAEDLNPSLYKVVYIPLSTVTVLEFYKSLAYGLDLDPPGRKVDIFNAIQQRLMSLVKDRNMRCVIIIDEAQYLQTGILNDLKLLLNFEMDSKDYATLILTGQPLLNNILTKKVHEALKQRIVMNYNFIGIDKEEGKKYILDKLKESGVYEQIITDGALEAIVSSGNGAIRKLNSMVDKCLFVGSISNAKMIDTDIVMNAQNELELI